MLVGYISQLQLLMHPQLLLWLLILGLRLPAATANVAKGPKVISRQKTQLIEEIDKLLLVFINEKQLKEDSFSEAFNC